MCPSGWEFGLRDLHPCLEGPSARARGMSFVLWCRCVRGRQLRVGTLSIHEDQRRETSASLGCPSPRVCLGPLPFFLAGAWGKLTLT